MGSGASNPAATELKTKLGVTNAEATPAWLEGEDIQDLAAAKAEISKLRKLMKEHLLDQGQVSTSAEAKKGGARAAVMDKGGPVGQYVEKKFDKSAAVQEMILALVDSNILFKHCKREEKLALVDAFESKAVNAGAAVITQGEMGDVFYAIESGSLDVYLPLNGNLEKVGAPLSAGQGFGELALMYNTPRAATVKASSACTLWCIDRATFRSIVTHFQRMRTAKYVGFLSAVSFGENKIKLGDKLTVDELERLAGALEVEIYQPGEFIIRQGNVGDFFYILEDGEVEIHKVDTAPKAAAGRRQSVSNISSDTKLNTLAVGSYFGEKALLSEDTRGASVVAKTVAKCLTLGRDDFVMMLGNLDELLSGKAPAAAAAEAEEKVEPIAEVQADCHQEKSLEAFDVIRTLGYGAFGRVKLVQHKESKQPYALKIQAKKLIVENSLQEHILSERRVILSLNHPFILKLHGSFKNDRYIYLVLELLQGGELFTHLKNRGQLEEPAAKFYAAQVLVALQHMHEKKIAYRDLKPENLVLDNAGYTKVVDFGLAKEVEGKTWTLCGTPDYLAPEIILNEGHDKAVDYWALGVLIYEMVAGMPPFYADDPMEVYEKILSSEMIIPNHFSRNLSDVVRKLLKIYQSKRLGNGRGGCEAIKKHRWFSGFDFSGLLRTELTAPIIPTVSDPLDASNFDTYDEDQEEEAEVCNEWDPQWE